VILVDDDASIRRALETQLRILGFEVVVYCSGEELLASELPLSGACLLLDIYMPAMNGLELCQVLAASGRQLPTILMTGRDDQQSRHIIRQAHPMASLFKPFDEITLLRAIKKAMRKRSLPVTNIRSPLAPRAK
jgi:FixJ family two-component response regulator